MKTRIASILILAVALCSAAVAEETEIVKTGDFERAAEALSAASGYFNQGFQAVSIWAPDKINDKWNLRAHGDARAIGNRVYADTWYSSSSSTTATAYNGAALAVSRSEAKDVIRALEILLKHAPEKYDPTCVTISGSGSFTIGTFGGLNDSPSRADKLRREADQSESDARVKRGTADLLDKEQADIEWARGVLAKWKAKL